MTTSLTIRTNNVPRLLKCGYEMPTALRSDFDYIDAEEFETHEFFVFKGQWYDLAEFMRCEGDTLKGWDGYSNGSAFHGVLIKLVGDDRVIVAQYFS